LTNNIEFYNIPNIIYYEFFLKIIYKI